jgi:hypothetical protein
LTNFRPTEAAKNRNLLTDPSAPDEGKSSFARYFRTGEAFIFNRTSIGGADAGI